MKEENRKVVPFTPKEPAKNPTPFRIFVHEFLQGFVRLWLTSKQFMQKIWNRLAQYYLSGIQLGRIVITPSAMSKRFGIVIQALFWGKFSHGSLAPADLSRIQEYSEQGSVVYVMYCRTTWDYIYFNQFFLRQGLPLAEFANGIDLKFLLPVWKMIHVLVARLVYRQKIGPIPDPLVEGPFPGQAFADIVRDRKPVLIFLTREQSVFSSPLGFTADPVQQLIEIQRSTKQPIFLVPQLIIWKQAPETMREKTFFDDIFGNPDKPSALRKTVHFLRYYRKAQVKFGQALNLREFLAQGPSTNFAEQARRVRWLLRHYLYRERKTISGPGDRPRSHVLTRILRHMDLKFAIERWVTRTGHSFAEGEKLAEKYAQEIVADRRWSAVMFLARSLHLVWKTFFDGVIIDEAQLEAARKACKDHPVVFVPNHRSHIDYLVVNWGFVRMNMMMPFICAGVNLNFWPFGPLFRRAGAYFIRRTYPEPDIYPAVLARYVREILSAGQPQMIFIEGGRSRTGKLLRPKLGMLSKIVEAYQAGICKDVVFVPISVGYDRILEEKSFLQEAQGGEKAKEDLGGMLRFSRRLIRSRFGKIYVNFGEPLSLAEFIKENDTSQLVENLSSRICYGINRVSVVYPTALMSLVLLSHRKRSLSRVEISGRTQTLIRYLEHRKVRFSDVFYNREYALETALQRLVHAGLIDDFIEEDFTFFAVPEDKRLLLNYYRNNIVHFFVTFSLLAISVLASARKVGEEDKIPIDEIEKSYEFLRSVFDWEFFFRPKESRSAYIRDVLEFFAKEGDLTVTGNFVHMTAAGRKTLKHYREITFHFLETYAVVLTHLRRSKNRVVEEKEFLKELGHFGKRLYVQGRIERFEAMSRFTLQNALTSFAEKGFLTSESRGAGEKRKAIWRIQGNEELFVTWLDPLQDLLRHDIAE